MIDHTQVKLGRQLPLPAERSRRVSFAAVFGDTLPPPPDSRDWTCGETTRPMLGNDTVGDCTCVAVANNVIGVSKAAYHEDVLVTTSETLALYSSVTKPPYDPADDVGGTNPTDNGAVFEDVVAYVLKNGFVGHHLVGSVAVDPANTMHAKQAIDKFGVLNVGLGLPLAWQNAETWSLDGYVRGAAEWQPYSWGGHEVCSQLYGPDGIHVWTWGGLQMITWDALGVFCDELDAPLWASWIRHGNSPGSDSLAILENYMDDIRRA